MNAALQVESPGLGVSIQDRGRQGHRAIGVPVSGALDPLLLAAANGLAGNPPDAAALEIPLAGPLLKAVDGPLRVALAGEVDAVLELADGGRRPVPAWSTATLHDGDRLRVGYPRGVGYLAVAGGLLTAPQLGSRSTYARAGLCPLPARLPCRVFDGNVGLDWQAAGPFTHPPGPFRVMPGPQIDHFDAAALERFTHAAFQVTRERDRMGLRLDGPRLAHNARGADIVSDGVTPGTIQVPADGRAIVLLADCQTVGGYPKIAVVIRADLPRLAHLQPGEAVGFCFVDATEAAIARTEQARRLADWLAGLRPIRRAPDTAMLLAANLAGAAVRGDENEDTDGAHNRSPFPRSPSFP